MTEIAFIKRFFMSDLQLSYFFDLDCFKLLLIPASLNIILIESHVQIKHPFKYLLLTHNKFNVKFDLNELFSENIY